MKCKIYAKSAKRFRKCIMNGISKHDAGKQYYAELTRNCKLQCLKYSYSVNRVKTVFRDCLACGDIAFDETDMREHSLEHLKTCKWFKRHWKKLGKSLTIEYVLLDVNAYL